MEYVITAIGEDHIGLADPLIHYITGQGANIAEIQMYDHDNVSLFSMMLRIQVDPNLADALSAAVVEIGQRKGLTVRVWSPDVPGRPRRLAICTTYRPEPAVALLQAIGNGDLAAEVPLVMGNRESCREIAEQYGSDWHHIGNATGEVDYERFVALVDEYEIDYVVLARFMRVLPPPVCWQFAGGRIINLHHGLLPSYPGMRPYHDAYTDRMLTFGATCHFIVPDLDAGNQIICQKAFSVHPGTKLDEVIRIGQSENEPNCLVEGLRRVVGGQVKLHFHHVIGSTNVSIGMP